MEKQKREVMIQERGLIERPSSSRTLAIVFIAVGVLFLLMNAGVFSFNDIGSFFGSFGEFFGRLGASFGEFFGRLGGSIGHTFGTLGSWIGRLWPLFLILLGAALLFRRNRPVADE
jgi:hypothetical protein